MKSPLGKTTAGVPRCEPLFSASTHRITRGGTVLPASKTGAKVNSLASDPEYSYASRDMGVAADWCPVKFDSGGKDARHVYLVEPLGDTEPDPNDKTSVRSREGFRVVDWVPKAQWSRALKRLEGNEAAAPARPLRDFPNNQAKSARGRPGGPRRTTGQPGRAGRRTP